MPKFLTNIAKRIGFSFILVLAVFALISASIVPSGCSLLAPKAAKAQVTKCPDLVQQALQLSRDACIGIGRNKACYGHNSLNAQAQPGVSNFAFGTQGAVADVTSIRTLTMNSYNSQTLDWGISYLRVQANLPDTATGENVTILLFGQTEIDDASQSPDIATTYSNLGHLNPFQAFYFRSNTVDSDLCEQMPSSGVIVQTPNGTGAASLVANGMRFDLTGGTVFMSARPGRGMTFNVVEGAAKVTADGVVQTVHAGAQVIVPMTVDMKPNGPPGPPEAYEVTHMPGVAVQYMPDPVAISAPYTGAICQVAQQAAS